MQAVSDEQLIQWVAAGDSSCLGTLFERHHRSVYRYCLQMTRQRALSEDLVQDVFLRMLRKAGSYRGDGSFKAWMFNIARNVTVDHTRRARRYADPGDALDAVPDSLIDSRSAEQAAAGTESMQRLVEALAALPDAVREVIWLGRFEFANYDELGVALDCSAGTARVRMHRAIKQLNQSFQKLNGAPIDV